MDSQQDKILKLEMTTQDIQIILNGIGKLPLETGIGVFSKIQQQVKEQLKVEKKDDSEPKI